MEQVVESRLIQISRKVISAKHLELLFSIPYTEYLNSTGQDKSIQFYLRGSDESSFKSSSISILSVERVRQKRMVLFEAEYTEDSIKRIFVRLKHGNVENEADGSFVEIGGPNTEWVNQVWGSFKDVLDQIPNQDILVYRYKYSLFSSVALLSIFITGLIFYDSESMGGIWADLFNPEMQEGAQSNIIGVLVLGLIISTIPYYALQNQIYALWPDMEIRHGEVHLWSEKRKRKWFWRIILSLVIPIAIAILWG